jgi:response regulator RpfG family c-di-GMP phosphodiesterase
MTGTAIQNPVTLLIEEDDSSLANLTHFLDQNNISVLKSKNRSEALDLIRKQKVDLMMVSGLCPNQEAYEFVSELRKDKDTKNIPLILMSAFYRSPRLAKLVESLEKTKYFVSPVSNQEIQDALSEFLQTSLSR